MKKQDLASGTLFVAIGAFFLYYSTKFTIGTPSQMGPGFYPTCVSTALIVLGIVTVFRAFRK